MNEPWNAESRALSRGARALSRVLSVSHRSSCFLRNYSLCIHSRVALLVRRRGIKVCARYSFISNKSHSSVLKIWLSVSIVLSSPLRACKYDFLIYQSQLAGHGHGGHPTCPQGGLVFKTPQPQPQEKMAAGAYSDTRRTSRVTDSLQRACDLQ